MYAKKCILRRHVSTSEIFELDRKSINVFLFLQVIVDDQKAHKIGLSNETKCWLYLEGEEAIEYTFCHCPVAIRIRYIALGSHVL